MSVIGAIRVSAKVHTSSVLLIIQSLSSLSSTFAASEWRSVTNALRAVQRVLCHIRGLMRRRMAIQEKSLRRSR
jgi:hypothetical protein